MALCESCNVDFEEAIACFYFSEENAIVFLQRHAILPSQLDCPRCGRACSYYAPRHVFRCHKQHSETEESKRVTKRCGFDRSIFKRTWLYNVTVRPHDVLRYVNIFLREWYRQVYVQRYLGWGLETINKWQMHACQICEFGINNFKEPLGGEGVVVEIDEHVFGKKGSECVLVFGAMERVSKRFFIIPIVNSSAHTLQDIIQDRILPLSVIYSDGLTNTLNLKELGYTYSSKGDKNNQVHVSNIKKRWTDVAPWVSNRAVSTFEELARYVFCASYQPEERFHAFLATVAKLFPLSSSSL